MKKRKRSEISLHQILWSEFQSPKRGKFWCEGKVTNIWDKNSFEILYSDGDYVDQTRRELFSQPPKKSLQFPFK